MGNVNGSDFMKMMGETVLDQEWMTKMYGTKKADQMNELKKVFTYVADNDVSADDKKALMAKAETIQEKVETLEAKMAVLAEELTKNEAEISKHAKAITNLATQAEDKTEEMQEAHAAWVQQCVTDVFAQYKRNPESVGGKDGIAPEIRRRIQGSTAFEVMQGQIDTILTQLDAKKDVVDELIGKADKWITQNKILEAQYGVTKSTYDLLNTTISRIGNNSTTYVNTDFDKNIPTYSPEKVAVISNYSLDPNINVPAGENPHYDENSQPPSLESLGTITEKYKDLLGVGTTGEAYSSSNKAVQALDDALNKNGDGTGIIEDLAACGLAPNQMAAFIAQNFGGAMIKANGAHLTIPYGHDNSAAKTYGILSKKVKEYDSSFTGCLNTWDKEGGNTINSNNQIKSLSENGQNILADMKAHGFTFKEAMYALFNPETGLFKDSGVSYNVNAQGDTPNYFIEFAGDSETAEMYKALSDTIYNNWGVRPSRGLSSEKYDNGEETVTPEPTDTPEPDPTTGPSVSRSDPIWFSLGEDKNEKFSFVIDRDKDGAFTNSEDFVGGSSSATWLEDLKSLDADGNGVLEGSELEELKVLGTKYTDGDGSIDDYNEYTPDQKAHEEGFDRQTATTVEYTLTNAAKMGITSINLNDLEGSVNQSKGQYDVNGSELFSDSFKFQMGDKEVEAFRQDETNVFMDTIYGDAYGKGFKLGLQDAQVQEIMDKDYGEYDKFASRFAQMFADINVLKNIDALKENINSMALDAISDAEKLAHAELVKAQNRAAAMKDVNGWDGIKVEVQNIARQKGVEIDMTQAKGIYVLDASLSASGVVDRYIEQQNDEQNARDSIQLRKDTWEAMLLGMQQGVMIEFSEAKQALEEGSTPEEYVKQQLDLQANQSDIDVTQEDFSVNRAREQEIYNAFNEVFDGAGMSDRTVEALARLCAAEIENSEYMKNKTGKELAEKILANMPKVETTPKKEEYVEWIRGPQQEAPTGYEGILAAKYGIDAEHSKYLSM